MPPSIAAPTSTVTPTPRALWRAIGLFLTALALCIVGYLALAVPGSWFPVASPKKWSTTDLTITRGTGTIHREALTVTGTDDSGVALITLSADFRSSEYPSIAWRASRVPEGEARILWRTDYAPAKVQSMRLTVVSGRLLPVSLADDPNWIGRITGLALLVRGPLPVPLRIEGVVAKPMGAVQILRDRFNEWLFFERQTGASINTVTGGAEVQNLSLPALLIVSLSLAVAGWFGLARRAADTTASLAVVGLLFIVAWAVLDVRWAWNLGQQVRDTAVQFGGKDLRGRHLAAEDGPLFAFIERARARLPATPVRVFMVADDDYLRGRGAYHLYPHNVYHDLSLNVVPERSVLRSGDYLVVYQRRGMQYDAEQQRLSWDGGEPLGAEAVLVEPSGAVFRIR